jgi:MFS family permease
MASARSVEMYAVGALLVGLSRASPESPGTALIGDNIAEPKTRQLAIHVRYFLINVAGAIGPLVGVVLGLSARQRTFWITAGVYAAYASALHAGFRRSPQPVHPDAKRHASLRAAMTVLSADHQFLLLVAANFIALCVYSQQESTLIQYVAGTGNAERIALVAALLTTNAVTIVTFQFPLLRLLRSRDLYRRTYAGLVLFGGAFLSYALLSVDAFVPWIVATWVLSVGEAILFPTLQLQADRLARAHLRGSYFGTASLATLGFGVGPLVGGWLLGRFGGRVTFTITAACVGLAALCYRQSHNRARV